MKKALALLTAALIVTSSLAGCSSSKTSSASSVASASNTSSSNTAGGSGSSGKIACIRNMTNSDHTTQFFAGCTAEGKALGYSVDTFLSNGDDVKMRNLMEQVLQKDYKIWIVSSANSGYQYDLVSKAVKKGIYVACFDAAGNHVPGVSYSSQDDNSLASLSLDALIDKAKSEGKSGPAKIIEINTLGALVPFDTRHAVIQKYEKEGKVIVVGTIAPTLTGNYYNDVYNGISTSLRKYGKGQIDGVWSASSAFLDAVQAALKDANRTDVYMAAPDISNTEIKRLQTFKQYLCCASVDPYVIGLVIVRLGVLESMGVKTPENVVLKAVAVTGDKLTPSDNMATLGKYFKDFGTTDLYNTPEIQALRTKFASK